MQAMGSAHTDDHDEPPGEGLHEAAPTDATGPAPVDAAPGPRRLPEKLDPESVEWVRTLSSEGAGYEEACGRLHALLLRIAFGEANRRGPRYGITGPELDDIAHQAAADALLSISRKIGEFRGDSRFTTWAFKFVVYEVAVKLGRHFWRTAYVPLDAEDWDRLPDSLGLDPVHETETRDMLDALHRAVDEVLTEHQRRVFVAIVLNETPTDALAAALGKQRNALYKTMFEARRKLRARLVEQGYLSLTTSRRS